ncbi:unnamed protein product [Laminaria digitata]
MIQSDIKLILIMLACRMFSAAGKCLIIESCPHFMSSFLHIISWSPFLIPACLCHSSTNLFYRWRFFLSSFFYPCLLCVLCRRWETSRKFLFRTHIVPLSFSTLVSYHRFL